jgi:hypothetical protein
MATGSNADKESVLSIANCCWRQMTALAGHYRLAMLDRERGRSSVVERQLPKLYVVGSIPIARSIV